MEDDIHGTLGTLKSLRNNLEELARSGKISQQNCRLILDHDIEHEVSDDISPGRRKTYLTVLKELALLLKKKSFKEATKKDWNSMQATKKRDAYLKSAMAYQPRYLLMLGIQTFFVTCHIN
ncbi:MAG: hypothetical protein V1875_10270 [Candidatus Altiarchaeota archaeon]